MRIASWAPLLLLGMAALPTGGRVASTGRGGVANPLPRQMEHRVVVPMLARDGLSSAPSYVVSGTVLAGPTCPVEQTPPEPGCAPRPVPNAVLVFVGQVGREVAQAVSDGDGHFTVLLPPGVYTLVAQPVPGLLHAPPPQTVVVDGPVILTVTYDTGIR